jgi:hypothetical protein
VCFPKVTPPLRPTPEVRAVRTLFLGVSQTSYISAHRVPSESRSTIKQMQMSVSPQSARGVTWRGVNFAQRAIRLARLRLPRLQLPWPRPPCGASHARVCVRARARTRASRARAPWRCYPTACTPRSASSCRTRARARDVSANRAPRRGTHTAQPRACVRRRSSAMCRVRAASKGAYW